MNPARAERLPARTQGQAKAHMPSDDAELSPDAGKALEEAARAAGLEPKQIADDMAVSHSLVLRGFKSEKSLSFHKLWELPDRFWLELIFIVATKRGIARVRRQIEEKDIA